MEVVVEDLRRHGDGPPAPMESLLWDDPELGLVHADPHAWMEAHPCDCEALCTCEEALRA
jgi:hypothetical protein